MLDMSDETLRQFGENVRRLRRIRGVSQEQLALQSGIARSYLGDCERGTRNVSLRNIVRISNALGVPASELMHGVG